MIISKMPPQISPVNALLLLLMCSAMISSIVAVQHPETRTESSSSSSMIRCIESERQALLHFKQGLVDVHEILTSWGSPHHRDCCQWRGIECSNVTGHVIALDLRAPQYDEDGVYIRLRGNISASLLVLKHLNYLDLSGNDFRNHPIPNFIGSLVNLQYLNLSIARIYGEIPPQFKNLSGLQYLDLSYNWGLFAKNFAWTSTLRLLKILNLAWVELADATDWVHAINSLPSLTYWNLESCSLSNPSQGSLVNSSKSLTHILLGGNNLPATSVYPWLFNISSNLVKLDLYGNFLQGSIPKEFGNLNSLFYLSLFRNQLQGPIPEGLGNISSLSELDLSFNQLEGEIPNSFGHLLSLNLLNLDNNNLTGDLGMFLSQSVFKSLKALWLESNNLYGSLPDITRFHHSSSWTFLIIN
ncbi:hypothetical protein Ancab_040338 [Ancistrocladus abbreviatus]